MCYFVLIFFYLHTIEQKNAHLFPIIPPFSIMEDLHKYDSYFYALRRSLQKPRRIIKDLVARGNKTFYIFDSSWQTRAMGSPTIVLYSPFISLI